MKPLGKAAARVHEQMQEWLAEGIPPEKLANAMLANAQAIFMQRFGLVQGPILLQQLHDTCIEQWRGRPN